MTPLSRRSHKKSRAGCQRCKKRKIKCDESKPSCNQCVKHSVLCDYEHVEVREQLLRERIQGGSSPSRSQGGTPGAATPAAARPLPGGGDGDGNGFDFDSPVAVAPGPRVPGHNAPPRIGLLSTTASSPVSRMLELRLMHQYTLHTCRTFTFTAPETEHVWRDVVPSLAFAGRHPYLLDAVMAVAALHLRSRSPGDKELVQASHHFMGSSLREYGAALRRGIDAATAEALFLTSTLIAFQSTAIRTFTKDETSQAAMDGLEAFERAPAVGAYTVPLSLFHSFQGVKAVTSSSWDYICQSTVVKQIINSQQVLQLDFEGADRGFFGKLLVGMEEELADTEPGVKPDPEPNSFSPPGNAADHEVDPYLAQGQQYPVQQPPMPGGGGSGQQHQHRQPPHQQYGQQQPGQQPHGQPGQQPPPDPADTTRKAYQHAVATLNWAHKIPHRGTPLAFPATVSKRFVELLEERRPRAMAILACYFALLRALDGVWWLHGMARREVLGVVSLFNNDFFGAESCRRWMPDLQWALDMALWEEGKTGGGGERRQRVAVVVDGALATVAIPPEVWGADWADEERRLEGEGRDFVSQIELVSRMASPVQSVPAVPDAMSIDGSTR